MNNKIEISKIDSFIEEEVTFLVNGQQVIGFDGSPRRLEVGKEYEAEIDIFVNACINMKEQGNSVIKGIQHNEHFSYTLWGELLDKNVLDIGFFITSDLFEGYGFLIGKYITLEVDRLQLYCE